MSNNVQLERAFADSNAANMSQHEMNLWRKCKATHRFMSYEDKVLVGFVLKDGKPTEIQHFECAGVSADTRLGLSSDWCSGAVLYTADHQPQEIYKGCFIWHPMDSNVVMCDHLGEPSLKFTMLLKMPVNWKYYKHDGVPYVLEKTVYEANYGV